MGGGRRDPSESAPAPLRRWSRSAWRRSKPAVRFFFSRQVAEQRLAEAQERERRLQNRLTQLEEEQQRALSRLARGQAQEGEAGPGQEGLSSAGRGGVLAVALSRGGGRSPASFHAASARVPPCTHLPLPPPLSFETPAALWLTSLFW